MQWDARFGEFAKVLTKQQNKKRCKSSVRKTCKEQNHFSK